MARTEINFSPKTANCIFQSLPMSREVEDKVISVDQTDFERVPVENSLTP